MDGGPPRGLAVGLLGPLRVSVDGRPVELPAGRVRALLAVLAMSAGRPVSLDRLASAVWGPAPPGDTEANVRTTVRRLRRGLGAEWIAVRPGGYVLEVDPGQVDALRFGRLLDEADSAADPAVRHARLSEALALWRGTPFDGVRSDWLEQALAAPLQERYLAAVERRADLALAGGVTTGLAAELTELALRFPLRESLWVHLLRVLQLSGRPAEALERYGEIRTRLAEELGVDPGPQLREAYSDLLAGRLPAPPPPTPAAQVVPRQLPPATRGFAGRHAELKILDGLLGDERRPLVVAAITGTAGVGKTTLAVHWAHLAAGEFPDGQFYADLRGFDPSGRAATPGEVLRGFLGALRVPPQEVPVEVAQQAALFRSLLAGTRTLILLDNARDADQVGPLLPGGPGCLVVVTSRDQLTGLVSAHGAIPIGLDLLSRDEARELLARRLGHDRTGAEPEAAEEVLDRCARLPLALAIVAARAAVRPEHPLAAFAERLRDDRGLAGVREIFAWSYRTLGPGAARLFRLIGLHPGPDIGDEAAASLAAVPVAEARSALAELTRAHLLSEQAPGRYTRHDLLESYAVELVHRHDSAAERRAATLRVLGHYAGTARAAAALVSPDRGGASTAPFTSADEAVAWFVAELPVLLAAVEVAEHAGFDRQVCQLAAPLFVFLHRRGLWHERAAVQRAALAAAERLGDPRELLRAHLSLAVAAADLRWYDEARDHVDRAWELAGDDGDRALVLHCRSLVAAIEGRCAPALSAAARARDHYRAAGNSVGYAMALTDVGWYLGRLGPQEPAAAMLEEALSRHEADGNVPYQAHTWSCLGDIHLRAGDRARSIDCYGRALDLFRRTGDRYAEATTLAQAGAGWYASGDLEAARDAWRQARRLLDHLDPAAAYQAWDQLRLIDERAAQAFRAL